MPFLSSPPRILLFLMLAAMPLPGADLTFAGALGNSGEADETLVTFAGPMAPGIGPVLDDARALWERGGAKQLNRYALDGRLLASFALPESTERNDQLTRAGDQLLVKIRRSIHTLPLNAEPGTKPTALPGEAEVMSSNALGQRVVIMDKDELFWLDAVTGLRTELFAPGVRVQSLVIGEDGTIYGFGEGKVFAWKDGQLLAGFPKGFTGERPQKIGPYWFSHSWHGTINRMNESFEPEPGVVLGGASGSFIGYMPMSNDLSNGRGMVSLGEGLYAVSGMGGVIQFVLWNEAESRFDVVRRIGALPSLKALALDANGTIWTPAGSWRWTDSNEAPATSGDLEPSLCAQPVMLGGKTICLLKKHYSHVQLARGPLIDANGLSHFETTEIKDFEVPDSVTGAAVFPDGTKSIMIVVEPNGKGYEWAISPEGQPASKPEPVTLPGLKNITSLAWFGDRLLAADSGSIVTFQRTAERTWKEDSRVADFGNEIYLHSDGKRLVVSDSEKGSVHLYESLTKQLASYEGLKAPQHVAVSGDRIVVYEAGRQHLVKLDTLPAQIGPRTRCSPFGLASRQACGTFGRRLSVHWSPRRNSLGRRVHLGKKRANGFRAHTHQSRTANRTRSCPRKYRLHANECRNETG
jgi:hypothetical protein